jgi:hypothetical protein
MGFRAVRLVLLHSPLVGPATWEQLAGDLRARGYDIVVPDFVPVMRGEGPYYPALIQTAKTALRDLSCEQTVLIAHSGAGALVPAIAQELRGPAQAVFVDALLPHPGRSWFETTPEELKQRLIAIGRNGRVPPWPLWWPEGAIAKVVGNKELYARFAAECPELPLDYLAEAAPEADPLYATRFFYLQLSASYTEVDIAEAQGWQTRRLPLHHLAMLSHPVQVADALQDMIGAATAG